MYKKCKIITILLTAIILNACGVKNTPPKIELKETVSQSGTILDNVAVGFTTKKEAISFLSSGNIEYIEDEDSLNYFSTNSFQSNACRSELYYNDEVLSEVYLDLFFTDNSSYENAEAPIKEYLSNKMSEDIPLSVYEDKAEGTTYYPMAVYTIENEDQVIYISFAQTEFTELPSPEYLDYGYEITEEYISMSDWELITSDTDADSEDEFS